MPRRSFLLSPAHCGGKRAAMLLSDRAEFDLAKRLRSAGGAPLGEIMSFLSGLYFRGKLAYARAFATPAGKRDSGMRVITTCLGLRDPNERIDRDRLLELASAPIDPRKPRYREPLLRDAQALQKTLGKGGRVVLLGSIATGKYVDVLSLVFGDRVDFPIDFVGRGDMSRGGLLLRAVAQGSELPYRPVAGAVRHGGRPPRLAPIVRGSAAPPAGARG